MRFHISKTVELTAEHSIKGVSADHPCSRLHSHNYMITVEISAGKLDAVGVVVDPAYIEELFKVWKQQNLNAFFEPTTAEVFCQVIWDTLEKAITFSSMQERKVRVESVSVSEQRGREAKFLR